MDKETEKEQIVDTLQGQKYEWKLLGKVTVDSSSLLICDPMYITEEFLKETKDIHSFNKNNCSWESSPYKQYVEGIAFNSGFGDGVYEVWGKVKDYIGWGKRISEVRIKLIDDD